MNDFSNEERAQILTQALPYIKKYSGKTIVVKYGGNAMTNEDLKMQVMEDLVLLTTIGIKVVLVHGGGPDINDMLKRLEIPSHFENGLRVTDEAALEVVEMVLAGKVNKSLVSLLNARGGNAIGISGVDGRLIECVIKDEALGYVGEIMNVNRAPLADLLNNGYIPVISTIGCDKDGNVYNINGDTAAAYIAGAIGTEKMIMMTNIDGILRDKNDPSTLIKEMTVSEAKNLEEEGVIADGMIPKVQCCIDAITRGVNSVVILDGRVPHSILMELLTNEGAGTMITGGEE